MDAVIKLRCTKWPPRSNFVTFDTPGASGFMWAAFLFTGKFSGFSGVAEALFFRKGAPPKITCSIWIQKIIWSVQNDPLALISWLLRLPGPQDLCGRLSSLRASFQHFWVLLRSTIWALEKPQDLECCVMDIYIYMFNIYIYIYVFEYDIYAQCIYIYIWYTWYIYIYIYI